MELLFQVRERLRVALERCSLLEEELGTTHKEVCFFISKKASCVHCGCFSQYLYTVIYSVIKVHFEFLVADILTNRITIIFNLVTLKEQERGGER